MTPLPMTRGRWLALALGVPAVLALIGWAGLTEVAFAGQGTYPVRLSTRVTGRVVSVSSDQANLRVRPAQTPGNWLRLTGTARYSLARSVVSWQTNRTGVTLHDRCRFAATGVCSFDYNVTVPQSLPVVISNGSGDVTLSGITRSVTTDVGSGNVGVLDLSGVIDLEAGSGDLSGTGLTGPRAKLMDHSGNITFSGLTSPYVTASNDSGDVTLIFTSVPHYVKISDQSGNVTLVLPPGGAARYNLKEGTQSGNNSVNLPTSGSSPRKIIVQVASGDITITH
jgi:hypothetical protein